MTLFQKTADVRQDVLSKARTLKNSFKRLFTASPSAVTEIIVPESIPSPTRVQSTEDVRKLLIVDDPVFDLIPMGTDLEIPEEVPVGMGRLQLRDPLANFIDEECT